MPKISSKQVGSAFEKYKAENPNDSVTTKDIFTNWLEADSGAFEKYVNDNNTAKPSQSLEEFKNSASAKPILQKAPSDYVLTSNSPTDAVIELVQLKKENIYQKTLRQTNILLNSYKAPPKNVFISYAWEDESTLEGRAANEKLQSWLQRVSKDLETVGIKVFLDIEGIQGKMSSWMENSIEQSDYIILVGTPRYKIRANADTNVAFEYQRILSKLEAAKQPNMLLPLLYSGDFTNSFPARVTEHLIRDFRQMEKYYHQLIGLVKPLGIVPNVYPDLGKNGQYYQQYTWLFDFFATQLNMLDAQLRNLKDNSLPAIADELPAASPCFVGRSQELERLTTNFKQNGLAVMAIQGMGGSGKSQLAAEYAYSSKISDEPYRLIRWLKADSEENLRNSYYSLGDDLGVERKDYKDSEVNLRRGIQTQLLRYENILLIYDNVESLDYLSGYQPSAGGNSNIHMLITTRNRFVDCPTLEIKEFTGRAVQEYLNKRLKKDVPQTIAEQLGQELGYLPLAIVQASSYMVNYKKTPEAFLKLLQGEGRQKVLEKELDPKLKTIATLWSMTLAKLTPQALEIILFCAYLNPDCVPQDLLEQMLPEDSRDEVLFELRSQSLLMDTGIEGQLFRVHRLLQEAVRGQLAKQDSSGVIAKAIIEKGVEALKLIIGSRESISSADMFLFWKARDYLNLQVVRLIEAGEKLKISEALLATLLDWAGEYQQHIILNFAQSLELYQRSLDIRNVIYKDNHPDVAMSLNNIGDIYNVQGQYDKALEDHQQALAIRRAVYGEKHLAVAYSLRFVGLVYDAKGQYDKAIKYYEQALVMRKAVCGGNNADVAASFSDIGSTHAALGQHDKALEYYQQALVIDKATYGDKHPKVAISFNNIGKIHEAQGRHDKALEYYQQALVIDKTTYGDRHPNIAISFSNIGNLLKTQGRYDKALEYYQQALAIDKTTYGDKHPNVAMSFSNIGNLLKAQGRYDKALEYYQQALAIDKATYGDKHPNVAIIFKNIALVTANDLSQSQVESLNLRDKSIDDAGATSLAASLPQTKITSLDLGANSIGDAGAAALANALPQSTITDLNLGYNHIGDAGAAALAEALPQSKVTSLNLRDNKIGATGAAALAEALPQSKVTSLNLRDNKIGATGAAALAEVLPQSHVTNLNLYNNNIEDEGVHALANDLIESQVTSLDLRGNKIEAAGAAVLAKALPLSRIENLNLGGNSIGDEGAAYFAASLPQTPVISFNLGGNNIGDAGVVSLAFSLPQTQITSLNLYNNDIGDEGTSALADTLFQSQTRDLNLGWNGIGVAGAVALANALPQSRITSLNLYNNSIGNGGAAALGRALPQSHITSLNLGLNGIEEVGVVALASTLPCTIITDLNLYNNNIRDAGATALANILSQSQVTSLDLGLNGIGAEGATALAKALPQTQVTSLDLRLNGIGAEGSIALAKVLPQSMITSLNLSGNNMGSVGVVALISVLPESRIISLNLDNNNIDEGVVVTLLQTIKSSFIMQAADLEGLSNGQKSILNNHLAINKLLSSKQPEDKPLNEYLNELVRTALTYINQPKLLDDVSFEKPKRLLLRAMELGSIQAIYHLGNLYLNELKNLVKAKEYYLKATEKGHAISKLCLELLMQKDMPDKLELGDLTIKLPRRFSINTTEQKLSFRDEAIIHLSEPNALVSKTGISLSALNELQTIQSSMDVFVATKDYEPIDEGHLHFSKGQTIYIKNVDGIEKNFVSFVKDGLAKSTSPYNRDRQGRRRSNIGFIPYDIFLNNLRRKPREEWSADEVCNAIIDPYTKPKFGEKAKPYVDTLPQNQRGKPFDGYILSYAKVAKFSETLKALNEHFKEINPNEVFIWIEIACVNQHAWMEMKSEDIGKVLEVNLTQLFTYVSEGRLIHFDKARPTNLTRSWCLMELLSCLKAQEETVAQTEICMTSDVQAEVLAQDLKELLSALDSSKAQAFNPQDKIAIDAQIKKTLTVAGEPDISMKVAYARLNAVVKSWLVTKFLPDFSNIAELKRLQEAKESNAEEESDVAVPQLSNLKSTVVVHAGAPLTVAYDFKKAVAPNPLLQEAAAAPPLPASVAATRRNSKFQALLARFQPRAKNKG